MWQRLARRGPGNADRQRWAKRGSFGASFASAALAAAALVGCASPMSSPESAAWPTTLYVNPRVDLPEKFRFVGNAGTGSNTMVVGHGFSSAVVQTDTLPEQSRLQLLYDHNRTAIATALVSRLQKEVTASKRFELAESLEAAQGELRIQVLDVGIEPADSRDTVLPYFRVEVRLYDKAGKQLGRNAVGMSNAAQLQTETAALLGDINGLRNFYDDGMHSVAQRALADLGEQP